MKVRIVQQMSGLRHDAEPWPGPGNTLEVTDEEGAALVHAGIAVPVEDRKAEERRPAADDPAVETRAEQEKPAAKEAPAAKATARKA